MEKTGYMGGCHCRAIRFEVVHTNEPVLECNCSICIPKGYLHLMVPENQFTLMTGREWLSTYTFNTHIAQHHFCKRCGIHPFYIPRSHPTSIDVNFRCLDKININDFTITPFDGKNWDKNVEKIR